MSQEIAQPASPPADFSLVLGGPLYQLWRRTRLSGDALQLLRRRILVLTGLAWVPLLILSAAEGHAWGTNVALPFLHDVELHVRFVLAMPLLILAELVVHRRMRPVVLQFVERGLIPDSARAQFDAALASAMRLCNSLPFSLRHRIVTNCARLANLNMLGSGGGAPVAANARAHKRLSNR